MALPFSRDQELALGAKRQAQYGVCVLRDGSLILSGLQVPGAYLPVVVGGDDGAK
jgi:hypothetical protein